MSGLEEQGLNLALVLSNSILLHRLYHQDSETIKT